MPFLSFMKPFPIAALPFVAALFLAPAVAEPQSHETDLLIVGATESGWAAAIQAARLGVKRITIVHDGEWFGGQFTEQALACVDENKGMDKIGWGVDWHPMRRAFHRSGLFKELMDRIESQNTEKYGSPMPGKPWHGPSTFRPAEAEAAFRAMIQPFIDSGQIQVFWKRYPVAAEVDRSNPKHPRLQGLTFAPIDLQTGQSGEPDLQIRANLTIDASDWGDGIQVSGAAYECGPDPPARYHEPSAPEAFPPNEMNPITWAMIVAESESATPIPEPLRFDDRNYPRATPFSLEAFRNLAWDHPNPGLGCIPHWPNAGEESKRQLSVFSVRRIVDGYSSKDGKTSILLNYMNGQDYPLERLPQPVVDALEATESGASTKNIVEMNREQRQIIFNDAKQHALGVLYHLQNFVHERAPDRTNSFRNFHLSPEFSTPDNLPPKPYIRESLRLKAMYMMREQDGRNRDSETKNGAKPRFSAVMYPDGLFAWQFHYDFHRTGRTYLEEEGASGPWIDYHKPNRHTQFISDRCVFPLRSLIPESVDGLLGAQGNVGFSSIVSAAIRLHDQRIHIGQAAGATAAVALREDVDPREIVYDRGLLEAVREGLCSEGMDGVPLLLWPFRDLKPEDEDFVVVNRLAARGMLKFESDEIDFRALPPTKFDVADLGNHPLRDPIDRISENDTDGDGILDRDDALLFTPNEPITWELGSEKLTPETDGLIADDVSDAAVRFDFAGATTPKTEGFKRDTGAPFSEGRGYGWTRDISANQRRRNAVAEAYRDTFLFTRTEDTWECAVENGRYAITVCVGDSGHEQPGQSVRVERKLVIDDQFTSAGRFQEATTEVDVTDGRLTVTIGGAAKKANTCLNWLVFRNVDGN